MLLVSGYWCLCYLWVSLGAITTVNDIAKTPINTANFDSNNPRQSVGYQFIVVK